MTAADETVVVLVTGPDRETLAGLGRTLVDERLIACLNIIEGVTSIYRWEGERQEDAEALGILKTTSARIPQLTDRIAALHPYDLPEVLVLPVVAGATSYLEWVKGEVAT